MSLKVAPMGWNSWDCYASTVDEKTVRQNAEYMAKNLKKYGWEYIVIDIQWYEPNASKDHYNDFTDVCIDEYGRLIPTENRFPSSAGGMGFKPLADYIHSLGLKFGIHLMRGIPRQAVYENCKIKGTDKRARDITGKYVKLENGRDIVNACAWNTDMYGVDALKEGAKEYYQSVFELYASWGIDFIKCDDIARELPHFEEELKLISNSVRSCGREMVLSISPGPAILERSEFYKKYADMWRITDDFWDSWDLLYNMFERAEKWSIHAGNGHWPDADMLPVGAIRLTSEKDHWTKFTEDEQYTMLTLWSIMRAPLIIGGEMTKFDKFTFDLLTNEKILDMHKNARHSHMVFRKEIDGVEHALWIASDSLGGSYVAIFNLGDKDSDVSVSLDEIEMEGTVTAMELWTGEEVRFTKDITAKINSHGVKVFRLG